MKKNKLWLAVILVLALPVFSGCSETREPDEKPFEVSFEHYHAASLDLKEQVPSILIEVPLVRQSTGYSCGVACTQSILRFTGYDFDVREDNLASALGANDETGTRYERIVDFLNTKSHYSDSTQDSNETRITAEAEFNLTVDELCAYLDQGKPVICAIQAWAYLTPSGYKTEYDSGHYVIAIGYDDENIYFMDPSTSGTYAYIPRDEFDARWHDMDGEDVADHFGIIITIQADYNKDLVYKIE